MRTAVGPMRAIAGPRRPDLLVPLEPLVARLPAHLVARACGTRLSPRLRALSSGWLTQPCRSTGRARRAPSILTSSDLPHDEAVSRGVRRLAAAGASANSARLPAVSSRPVSSQPPVQAGPPDAAHLLGAHVLIDPRRRAPPRARLRSSSESGKGLRAPEGIRSDSATAVARIAQRDGRILFVIHYR